MFRHLLIVVLSLSCGVASAELNWHKWRGPSDAGSVEQGSYPSQLGKPIWKVPLPGKGCSTPIVLNETIFLTAPVDGKDALVALDWQGKQRWATTFGDEFQGKHRNGSGCNPSPTTDGATIYVNYKSGTLAAVDLDGKIRWQTNLVERFGKDTLFWDHGTSPVLTNDHVVMARMHKGESWLAAFDKQTGEMAWKQARNFETPVECDHGYSTPLVIQHGGKEAILVWGAQHITIHDAATGVARWTCGNFNPENKKLWPSIATPVIVDDTVVIAYGRNDRGIPRLHGIRLGGEGDVTETNHAWGRDDIGVFVPSPVAYQGKVYLVRDKGEVECLNPKTGKSIWRERFPKARANFYASPLIAGGKLYAPREDGVVFVADIRDGKFKLLHEQDLGESVIGSPVAVNNRLLLRGIETLFCYE